MLKDGQTMVYKNCRYILYMYQDNSCQISYGV